MRTVKRHLLNSKKKTKEQKIFILNDLHFKAGVDGDPNVDGATSGTRYYYASPPLLRNFVDIVNKENPDLVLLLGDVGDKPSDFPLFNQIWSGIDSNIKTAITIGNHDFDDHNYSDLVTTLNYDHKVELVDSKFNQVIELNVGGIQSKFIILDATYNNSNEHGSHYQNVRFHSDVIPWLESELLTGNSDRVFIGTHVSPHQRGTYFDEAQAIEIDNMLNRVQSIKSELETVWLFGHQHLSNVVPYDNMGAKNMGYLSPAMILSEDGRFSELKLKSSSYEILKRDIKYSN